MTIQELKNKSLLFAIILGLTMLAYSCSNTVILDSNKEFVYERWSVDDVFETTFDISDTINNYNFFITIRNSDEYPYQNVFVFLTTSFPNGKTKLDTINCPLANRQGKWLGKGFGGVYDNRILYMARKRFPLEGKYKIRIEQAMRDEELFGVMDVGVRIEQAP